MFSTVGLVIINNTLMCEMFCLFQPVGLYILGTTLKPRASIVIEFLDLIRIVVSDFSVTLVNFNTFILVLFFFFLNPSWRIWSH
jgi:hypothetical protein